MTLILPHEIINDTPADALPVDTNYKTISQHINTNLVDRDGSVAMTGQLTLVGDPVQANQAARKAYVDAILPVGVMLPWLGVAAPAGSWALANGASLSTTTYNKLYLVLGTRYGGSGGTFMLPNMAGIVPVGIKAGDARYQTLGNYGGSTKVPVPSHIHKMDHNHPQATTANETQLHQHPIDHNHASFTTAAGGQHDHYGRYLNDSETTGASMRWVSPGGSATSAEITQTNGGPHGHVVDIPNFDGNSQSQSAWHNHVFDVPAFVGNTAAYSLEIADADAHKSTTDFYAPFVVINYIVRIA